MIQVGKVYLSPFNEVVKVIKVTEYIWGPGVHVETIRKNIWTSKGEPGQWTPEQLKPFIIHVQFPTPVK